MHRLWLFERMVVWVLVALLGAVIIAALVQVTVDCWSFFWNPAEAGISVVLGQLFMVLIALELLHTIKLYLQDQHLHVDFVIVVAMIALARKAIILDFADMSPLAVISLAVLFLALALGLYLVRRSGDDHVPPDPG